MQKDLVSIVWKCPGSEEALADAQMGKQKWGRAHLSAKRAARNLQKLWRQTQLQTRSATPAQYQGTAIHQAPQATTCNTCCIQGPGLETLDTQDTRVTLPCEAHHTLQMLAVRLAAASAST